MAPIASALVGAFKRQEGNLGLTQDQVQMIVAFERAGACISILGVLLIFLAFSIFKRLRTVPNHFIVFASFANLGASLACLIGYNGILAGKNSALCQAQAFMFELFMQSDPWWSLAMAVNVYMVFFFAANPKSFLRYWWAYFIVCYGIPLIPSLVLLLVQGKASARIYGNATIWCWIDQRWTSLRIWTYYLPIWVCILLSSSIYLAVGVYVFKKRNQLRNLSLSDPSKERSGPRDSAEKQLHASAAAMGSISAETTHITTVHVASPRSATHRATINWFAGPPTDSSAKDEIAAEQAQPTYHTMTEITAQPKPKIAWYSRVTGAYRRWCSKFAHMDPVKLAYLRTSFIFAISVLVTWTPSSINRVHDLVTRSSASFGLNLASGIVLPLQGVWNAVIFFSTSWKPLKEESRILLNRLRGLPRGLQEATAVRKERERGMELESRRHRDCMDDTTSDVSGSTMRVMRDGSMSSFLSKREPCYFVSLYLIIHLSETEGASAMSAAESTEPHPLPQAAPAPSAESPVAEKEMKKELTAEEVFEPHILAKTDPEVVKIVLRGVNAGVPPTASVPVEERRAHPDKYRVPWARSTDGWPRVTDTTFASDDGAASIPVKVYHPDPEVWGEGPYGVHLNFHGGGFVFGDLEGESTICDHMRQDAGVVVIDVNYRHCPEVIWGKAIEDAWSAVKWVRKSAESLKVKPDSLSIGGISAGGHISLVLQHILRDEGIPLRICLATVPGTTKALFYNFYTDSPHPSFHEFFRGPILPWATIKYFGDYCFPRDRREERVGLVPDWWADPLNCAPDWAGLGETYIRTAETDPLRDEGEAYAFRLAAAGNKVSLKRYQGVPHTFMFWSGLAQKEEWEKESAAALRVAHGTPAERSG